MATPSFAVPSQIELAYRLAIGKLVKSWLPAKLEGASDSSWLSELANLSTRKSIIASAAQVAANMITKVNVTNVKSWRIAAMRSQGSGDIYRLLREELEGRNGVRVREIINENALYLSEIPADIARQLNQEIAIAQQQGTRPEAIRIMLRSRFPEIAHSKISMLARTQSSSANTALTKARSEELDLPCFIWETSQDGKRVRLSHQNMQGVVVFWKDLPSPEALIGMKAVLGHYAPGNCPNCRCNPLPILTVEDVYANKKSQAAKVYFEGRIQNMTRANFARLSGIESRLAA